MSNRHLLYLDASGLRAWRWRAGRLQQEPFFSATEIGHSGFATWLTLHRGAHFTLVTDCVEEGFQIETLPYVVGTDRQALIVRKQAQLFYGSPFVTALSLGRERGGRRDERLLFAALTRPAMLEPWMERLRAADAVLTGITTTAFLVGELLQTQLRGYTRLLVVCLSPAGVRQTLFDEGRLRFSRLATTTDANTVSWELSIPFEVQKTYQYLVAQRIVTRGAALTVAVIGHPQEATALHAACKDGELLHYQILDLQTLADATGLNEPLMRSDALPALLHVAARRSTAQQFAPTKDRVNYRWWIAQRTAYAIGFVGLLAMLGLAAKTMLEAREREAATTDIRLDARTRTLHFERLLASLPHLPATLESLRASVDQIESIDAQANGPAQGFIQISRVMDHHPQVQLQRLEWVIGTRVQRLVGEVNAPATQRPPPAMPAGIPVQESAYSLRLSARLLDDPPLSQRETVEAINTFVADIKREGGAQRVTVLHMPFEFTSDRTLRNTSGKDKQAAFEVQADFAGGATQ